MAQKFPAVGALIAQKNIATGTMRFGVVTESNPEEGYIIFIDDEKFKTRKLNLQAA